MASMINNMPSDVYSLLTSLLVEFGTLGAAICIVPWLLGMLWDMLRGLINSV